MRTEFHSRHIKEMLGVHKRRVEYLMKEVPIEPKLRVEGTGRAHEFSYKNVVEFFIAEYMAAIGLSMKEIRFVISVLDEPSKVLKAMEPLPANIASFVSKDLDVVSTEWSLGQPKGGPIARDRRYVVAIYDRDKVQKTFKNYYLPSQKSKLYMILSVPDAPLGNYYWLGITENLASFDRDLSGPTSHYVGKVHTILDVGGIKRAADVGIASLAALKDLEE